MPTFDSISRQVHIIQERILTARENAGATQQVTLEIAGKTRSPEENFWAAQSLADAGLDALIGHNRVQEARECEAAIRRVPTARIHLIGPLQSNKINHALGCVDLIETIDSVRLIEGIDKRVSADFPVFIQVNTSGEESKSGCSPTELHAVLDAATASKHVRVTGLMTIGLNSTEEAPVRRSYEALRMLRDEASGRLGVPVSELALSMGMSRDLEWAIAEGATIVRVGTDIFGPRAVNLPGE